MVTTLKYGSRKESISRLLTKIAKGTGRGFDAHKYSGVLNLKVDPVVFQKTLRDEWE